MSTVRIQVRRGTASQWTSANPILAAGEMGVETDTNKFKFGNGTSTWSSLSYAAADAAGIGEISQDAINTALTMGSGLTKTYNDGSNTITINVDNDVIATVDYVDNAVAGVGSSLTDYIPVSDRGIANGVASLNSSVKVPESQLDLDGITLDIATSGTIDSPAISTAELVATDITSGGQIDANNVVISGTLTVSGTTTTVNTTNLSVTDPLIQVASDNNANTVDVGFVGHFNDGTSQHTGLVRDSSESKWKLFKGVTTNPTTNVDFTQGSLDDLAIAGLTASSASIGNVSNIELQYLNGVTSPIQTQIDGVVSDMSANFASKTSPVLSDPTFTGTVDFPDDSINTADIAANAITNAKIADSAINNAKIAGDAAIAQSKISGLSASFAEKAPLNSPTFTGSVVLPSTTSIGNLSSTEIGYLDGITSSVQTQITAAGTALSNHESDTTNIHGILDTADLATKLYAENKANLAQDAAGTAADTKIATAVAALTKSSVGLGNVDNISDANKPVSTATQTALDAKLSLAGGTLTGALTLSGAPTSDLHAATKLYVDGLAAGINFHQPVVAATAGNLAGDYNNGTNGLGATLTGSANGAIGTIDGASVSVGSRILLKSQTDATQNGIYTVTNAGSGSTKWVVTRAVDADNNPAGELATGDFVFVTSGSTNGSKGFILSTTGTITVGTTNVNYSQFNASEAVVAGTNITKSGATIAVADAPTFSGAITASSGIVFSDGTQTKEGVPSRTPIIQKTASYTLSALTERDSMIEVASSSATTITIPANSSVAYPVGTSIDILQTSTGQVTIAAGAGVTVNATPGLKLRTQWSGATLFKRATDTWVVYGDLSA